MDGALTTKEEDKEVPVPSWPSLLEPQQYTFLETDRAQEWYHPVDTLVAYSVDAETQDVEHSSKNTDAPNAGSDATSCIAHHTGRAVRCTPQ